MALRRPSISLNLTIYEGEVFGFLGPNGAGKTTSILMFLGLTEPTSGKVTVVGFDPTRDPFHVKEKVGYLPENVGFYDDMDARQNLRYIARLNRIPDKVSDTRIDETLSLVGLLDEAKKKVGTYSKGMRQRLGIGEVLIKDPKLIFLDEPTIGLDPDGTNRMLDLIHALSREQKDDHLSFLPSARSGPEDLRPGRDHDQGESGRRRSH